MSLTQEQEKALQQLNKVFRRFEAQAELTSDDPEQLVHQFMMEEFPLVSPDAEHMQKLSDMRKSLLGRKSATPVAKPTENGDLQRSFE